MRARWNTGSGLEGAPDIMLLTMAALMVAIVWLVSNVQEATLPPIELPESDGSRLGSSAAAAVVVTLRPGAANSTEVWLEDERVLGGTAALRSALEERRAGAVTLRADADTRWEEGLRALGAAASLGLPVSIAADP